MGRPTILDVAERAGVSKSLVSLVMGGSPNVSDGKRAAVLQAAREIGYRPNAMARSLVRQRSHLLGVLVGDLHNPFFAEVVEGVEEQGRESDLRPLLVTGFRSPKRESEVIEDLLEFRPEGLVLTDPQLATRALEDAVGDVPSVVIARVVRSPTIDVVVNDDRVGPELAVTHLVELGHRRIAHIDGGNHGGSQRRRSGYRAAMRRHGLDGFGRIVRGDYSEEGGAAGARELLASGDLPTAIVAANDAAALGTLEVLDEARLRVPDDVSLVGYDNTHLSALRHISLTTIDQPRREMGRIAVELLLERQDGRSEARHVVLPPRLIVRATTAPPREGVGP